MSDKILVELTHTQLEAVLHEVGHAVSRLETANVESDPLFSAERELDGALMAWEQDHAD